MNKSNTGQRRSRLSSRIIHSALLAMLIAGCGHGPQPAGIDTRAFSPAALETLQQLSGAWHGELGKTGVRIFFHFPEEAEGRVAEAAQQLAQQS